MTDDEMDPKTRRYFNLALAAIVALLILGALLAHYRPMQTGPSHQPVYSPTYTELPAGAVCRGQLDVVKKLDGTTHLVCEYP